MRRLVPALAIALTLASCSDPAPGGVAVDDAIVTLPAVAGRPGAAYFRLQTNVENVVLTGISSPRVGRIELHETMAHGTMSSMRPIGEIALGREPLAFEPGGRHAMLFEIEPGVVVGGRLSLTLAFRGAPPVTVEAEVRAPGDVRR